MFSPGVHKARAAKFCTMERNVCSLQCGAWVMPTLWYLRVWGGAWSYEKFLATQLITESFFHLIFILLSTAAPLLANYFVIGMYFFIHSDRQNRPMERQIADFVTDKTVFSMRQKHTFKYLYNRRLKVLNML